MNYAQTFFNCFQDILLTMAYCEVDAFEIHESVFSKKCFYGTCMEFQNQKGKAALFLTESTARFIVMNMLAISEEEITEKDIHDNVKELLNMMCGSAKARLTDTLYHFELNIPEMIDTIKSSRCSEISFYINSEQNFLQIHLSN